MDPNKYISTVKHVACVYAEGYRDTHINPFHMDTCFAVYITGAAKPDVNVVPYVVESTGYLNITIGMIYVK